MTRNSITALNDLVFTDIHDSPDNPRLGLGYHQLYDPTALIGLITKLPDVTRVGDTITLYWDGAVVQQYDLDQATIDKGWLSFSVSPGVIFDPQGKVYYTLYDHQADDLQTSVTRTITVNRRVPGGLDPDTDTAINENMVRCTVSPNPVTSPTATVVVSVPAWINQELGDELTVMWNNIRVTLAPLATLGAQSVTIPREVLEAGGSSDKLLVNYEIRDIVDNYSLVSPSTYVRVEIDPNALPAPRVDEADRTTLILDLEALGDKDAHVTIPAYIGNGNPYTVTLTWIGKTPTADISLNLPPKTVDDPDFDHATFTIPNAHLQLIAGGSAVVRYSLVQQGTDGAKQSKTTSITLTGLPVELDAPVIMEAGGSTLIDLALITGPSVTVTVPAYPGQSEGDKILLNWKGTPVSGSPVNYTDDYTIKVGEELRDTTFIVLRENLDPLANGTLDLSYQVVFKAIGNAQNSPVTTYRIKSAVAATYPPPIVKEAPAGVLDPMQVLAGATLTVAYDDMLSTDTIAPIWNGINNLIEWKPGNASKSVDFLVPASVVAASLGKTFDVDYGVLRGGNVLPSQMLRLTVSPLPHSELLKSRPVITEANQTTNVLDLNSFTGDAHVTVAKWPLIGMGQKVWLTVKGLNGVPTLKLLEAYPVVQTDVSNGLEREIHRIGLEEFADGSQLTVICKVAFDGVTKVPFPKATYTVKQVDELSIDNSLMLLDGRLIHGWDPEPINPPANTYKDRAATGGVLPYTYRSSNEAVVYVNEVTGRVFSVGNGDAHITVSDHNDRITSYPVTVLNVLQIFNTNLSALYSVCANQAASMGGHILTLDEWREFRSAYHPNHKGIPSEWCWSSTPANVVPATTWLFGPDNGQSLSQPLDHTAPGFGLIGLLPVDPEPQITITNMYYSTLFVPSALHPLANGAHLPAPGGELVGDRFQITLNCKATPNVPFVFCISNRSGPIPGNDWDTVMVPSSGIVQFMYGPGFHPRIPQTPPGRYSVYQRIAGQAVELPWSFIL